MRSFTLRSVANAPDAVRALSARPGASDKRADGAAVILAGGTTLVDLMKLQVMQPAELVDMGDADPTLSGIDASAAGLRIGARARMADVASHPDVLRDYPVVAEALQKAASQQLRNMATMAGNLLQRTRCAYLRDTTWKRCNKRNPGSGCDAVEGSNREHAILGVSEQCIASYAGDFAHAFVALDGVVDALSSDGLRSIRAADLHLSSGESPSVETTLKPGEVITALHIPGGPWTRRSTYLKVRDRASYQFAVTSAAVALDIQDGLVREARIGLGGMTGKPWRSRAAEHELRGCRLDEAVATRAAAAAFADAQPRQHNAFKKLLGEQTLVRALLSAAAMEL
ncbi:FAD binding domain-containing protein [Roseomonas mucosa]|nr:FAD binding domain-containing protein [Roseomonas mucosa]